MHCVVLGSKMTSLRDETEQFVAQSGSGERVVQLEGFSGKWLSLGGK